MRTPQRGAAKGDPRASLVPLAPEVEQLRAVYELAVTVNRADALPEIYEAALDALQASLGADRASILLFDAGGVMRFEAWRGLSAEYRAAVEGHSPWSPGERAATPVLVPDVQGDPSLDRLSDVIRGEGIRALGFIPLYAGERLIGKFMVYFDAPHAFTPEEVRLAEIIASHVAFAVDRRRSADRLNLYREVFAHSIDGIAIFGTDGRYVEQNGAHESLIGHPDAELSGQTPALHLGEETFAEIVAELARRGTVQREVRSRTAAGITRELDLSAFAVRDAQGRATCYVGIERDITEKKRAENAVRFLAEASGRLDASLDPDTTLATVAELAVPYLGDWCLVELGDGSEPRRVAAAHADAAQRPRLAELREARLRAPRLEPRAPERGSGAQIGSRALDRLWRQFAGDPAAAEVLRQLGAAFALCVPLMARGRTLGTITLVSASAARRYGDADLALAQELGRRAGLALDNARLFREVQESDRGKDVFLAMLAHELRNPLAPVLTALQLMELRPNDAEVAGRARGVLGRQVRHMTRLVDDLLDVSRITRGKINLRREPVEVAAVAARALEAARPLLEARRIELATGLPSGLWLEADPVRLEQVLLNLLNNAAKFTEPGGRVRVWAEARGPWALIGVADNGVGIAPAMLPRIFDLFMQGERPLDRAQGGLGIGLTLVRRLVEMHGGSVRAASGGPGMGSEFLVELPLAETPPHTVAEGGGRAGGRMAVPRRVLVVDDNVDAARTLAEALGSWGHEVHVVHEGPAAVEEALRLRPDVVLLDIGLPRMDGYAVAGRLRAEPSLAGTSLIALSGYGQAADREKSCQAGFRDHLVKPVDLVALASLLA
jgi:PAS domain S-box-containing protein